MDENQKIVDALNKRMKEEGEYKPFLKKQSWFQLIAIAVSVLVLSILLVITCVLDLDKQALPNIMIIGGSLSLIVIVLGAILELFLYLVYRVFNKKAK